MKRDFKGIWIPAEIWLAADLSIMEKLFLVEIDSLDNEKGCFASNAYFAEFFGISTRRVSEIINELVSKKMISSTVAKAEGNERILRTLWKKTSIPYRRKVPYPMEEKFHHNNTDNNTGNKKESEMRGREWEFPLRDLFEAFPNLNLTPAQVGVIESEIKLGDETPWKLAIEKYRLNYDPALNRYDPSKVGNLLSVFREFKAQEKRNGQHTAISAKTGQYKDKRTVEAERIEAGYARVAELRRIADEQDARQQGALLGNGHGIDYQVE